MEVLIIILEDIVNEVGEGEQYLMTTFIQGEPNTVESGVRPLLTNVGLQITHFFTVKKTHLAAELLEEEEAEETEEGD